MRARYALSVFFFNDTATTEIYTLSLHDALPISLAMLTMSGGKTLGCLPIDTDSALPVSTSLRTSVSTRLSSAFSVWRSEEDTSELQSRPYLVCRLLLEKKKKTHLATQPAKRPHT